MKKSLLFLIYALLLTCRTPLWCQSTLPPCYQDLATQFFKYEIVAQSFSVNNINQNLWDNIVSQLKREAQNVPQLIQQQAQKMNPNPLYPTFQVVPATQLLHDTLFAVFRQVLLNNYITMYTNEIAINSMFKYIWMQQLPLIQNCLGPSAVQNYILTQ